MEFLLNSKQSSRLFENNSKGFDFLSLILLILDIFLFFISLILWFILIKERRKITNLKKYQSRSNGNSSQNATQNRIITRPQRTEQIQLYPRLSQLSNSTLPPSYNQIFNQQNEH
ncbi:hypothetical protein BpHYR1_010822 [Brachionus plicatilis]|uniref:Transmembrane protein n=1 Tax=Brachionus plicatilis TaxID=10195 RepID=A0A3M7R5U1_BRAPC|nr:hypothetical protein BpHYR1_010822 [Brachionus plicatilis]